LSAKDLSAELGLVHPWPDPSLTQDFVELLAVFKRLFAAEERVLGPGAVQQAYRSICSSFRSAGAVLPLPTDRGSSGEWSAVQSLKQKLRQRHPADWLQRLASLLAGLMHFVVDDRDRGQLVNRRRPRKPFSTYPSSPALAELLGDGILSYLETEPVPACCRTLRDAHQFVERALNFHMLDPSMESGQLLLGAAFAAVRRIHRRHPPGSRGALLLVSALLERLCADCLWGIDRNELAADTVRTLFSLLGTEFGLAALELPHLRTADALADLGGLGERSFDGVINNPPWGESLAPEERERVRRAFPTVHHHLDTYVAFMELTLDCLKPGGAFAVVLPTQMLGARNSGRLRAALLERASLDRLLLLPRAPFARAAVRGIVIVGRAGPQTATTSIRLSTYPLVKRLTDAGQPSSFTISRRSLANRGTASWWPVIAATGSGLGSRTVPLGRVAEVFLGVQVYQRGRGSPPQSEDVVRRRPFSFASKMKGAIPAVRGREVKRFAIGPPACFIQFGRWLARTGSQDELRGSVRIFLRELCRRDGRLTAAIAEDGYIPLHGVLTVLPQAIDARLLAAILNSESAATYVRGHAASFSKVDFQRITVQELRAMPIPIAAVRPSCRAALGLSEATASERSRCRTVLAAVAKWCASPPSTTYEAERVLDRLDHVVRALFQIGDSP